MTWYLARAQSTVSPRMTIRQSINNKVGPPTRMSPKTVRMRCPNHCSLHEGEYKIQVPGKWAYSKAWVKCPRCNGTGRIDKIVPTEY